MVSRLEDDQMSFFFHIAMVRCGFVVVFGQELEIKLGNLKRWGVTISPAIQDDPGWSRWKRTWSHGPVEIVDLPSYKILDVSIVCLPCLPEGKSC